ncbi:MAG: peptidoglycan-associated lipoprotein Pal [Deltaproteobacteria bacterium]|nr:peptidoglycan-associated lipoprotein Pal [Deltaproteobacteria bacterium]
MNFIMKNTFKLIICALLVAGLGLTGCGKKPIKTKSPVETVKPKPKIKTPKAPIDISSGRDIPEDVAVIEDVFFDYNRYSVRGDMRDVIKENARALNSDSSKRVLIEGHCDERGTEEYNIALGDRRAQAIKKYLQNLGVSSSRITTRSYGEQKPFCEQSTESCWQSNRRGHLVVR